MLLCGGEMFILPGATFILQEVDISIVENIVNRLLLERPADFDEWFRLNTNLERSGKLSLNMYINRPYI